MLPSGHRAREPFFAPKIRPISAIPTANAAHRPSLRSCIAYGFTSALGAPLRLYPFALQAPRGFYTASARSGRSRYWRRTTALPDCGTSVDSKAAPRQGARMQRGKGAQCRKSLRCEEKAEASTGSSRPTAAVRPAASNACFAVQSGQSRRPETLTRRASTAADCKAFRQPAGRTPSQETSAAAGHERAYKHGSKISC